MLSPRELGKAFKEAHDEIAFVKKIIRRGWDDHMFNFELMDERDENWLLAWAGMADRVREDLGFPVDAPRKSRG